MDSTRYESEPLPDDPPIDSKEQAEERAEAMAEAIHYHDQLYYVKGRPKISDDTYDTLLGKFKQLENMYALKIDNSPTSRVGVQQSPSFDTVWHSSPMLSIEDGKNREDLQRFYNRAQGQADDPWFLCMPKFDGLSIEAKYHDGWLRTVSTRGDGHSGDDITENARTIRNLPLHIEQDGTFSVRGEVIISHDDFEDKLKGDFSHPRNAAVGSLRLKDPTEAAKRPLQFIAFDVLSDSHGYDERTSIHRGLSNLGFLTPKMAVVENTVDKIEKYREDLMNDRGIGYEYPIDGVVVAVNDLSVCKKMGSSDKYDSSQFAYKFPNRDSVTKLLDITPQVSRTGLITPVAELDPVVIDGVEISRASLHNMEMINEKGVAINDTVKVERAGDVIPHVVGVVRSNNDRTWSPPPFCPSCGAKIDGLKCDNSDTCPAQVKGKIEHFVSKKGLDIKGIGPSTVQQFVDYGLIGNIPDLYDLDKHQLRTVAGMGKKSAKSLIQSIEDSKNPELADFIQALGTAGVGNATAKSQAKKFGNIYSYLKDPASTRSEELARALLSKGVKPQPHRPTTSTVLDNETFVLTGSMEMSRSEAKDEIEKRGGKVTGSVSGNTDYLVVGENPGDSKLSDAEDNDTQTISGDEFEEML